MILDMGRGYDEFSCAIFTLKIHKNSFINHIYELSNCNEQGKVFSILFYKQFFVFFLSLGTA